MESPSDAATLERCCRLVNIELHAVALQRRRLRSVEPEDERFVMRWWTDLGFLMVALLRLRRAAGVLLETTYTSAELRSALAGVRCRNPESPLDAQRRRARGPLRDRQPEAARQDDRPSATGGGRWQPPKISTTCCVRRRRAPRWRALAPNQTIHKIRPWTRAPSSSASPASPSGPA